MSGIQSKATGLLVGVFVSGILMGGVAMRLVDARHVAASVTPVRMTADEYRKQYLAELRGKVGLNDQQITAVTAILDDTRKKVADLRQLQQPQRDKIQQDQVAAMRALLTEQQKPVFDAWRAERIQARKKQQ